MLHAALQLRVGLPCAPCLHSCSPSEAESIEGKQKYISHARAPHGLSHLRPPLWQFKALSRFCRFLPAQFYWIGLSRDAADASWQYVDGSVVQQVASNVPYAHWSWNMPTFSFDAARPTWNCIQVSGPGQAACPQGAGTRPGCNPHE